MEIKLDTQALNALFPEGSQARVELRQAVVQNFVNRNFIRFTNEEMSKMVMQAVKETQLPDIKQMIDKRLNVEFTRRGWNGVDVNEGLSSDMRKAAEREVDQHFSDLADKYVESGRKRLEGTFERNIKNAMETATAHFESLVTKRLAGAWNSVIDAAIKLKLGFQ